MSAPCRKDGDTRAESGTIPFLPGLPEPEVRTVIRGPASVGGYWYWAIIARGGPEADGFESTEADARAVAAEEEAGYRRRWRKGG